MIDLSGVAEGHRATNPPQLEDAGDGQFDRGAELRSQHTVRRKQRGRVQDVSPRSQVDDRPRPGNSPARPQLARRQDRRTPSSDGIEPARSTARLDLPRRSGPPRRAQGEVLAAGGRHAILDRRPARGQAEPHRSPRRDLTRTAQPECGVAVRVVSTAREGRDRGRGCRSRHGESPGNSRVRRNRLSTLECQDCIALPTLSQPLARQLAPCLRVTGVRVEPVPIASDGSIGVPRASEDPRQTDDGVALAGREPEGIIVRAQRVTVTARPCEGVAQGHVAPRIGRLQGDVAAEQLERTGRVTPLAQVGETIGRARVLRIDRQRCRVLTLGRCRISRRKGGVRSGETASERAGVLCGHRVRPVRHHGEHDEYGHPRDLYFRTALKPRPRLPMDPQAQQLDAKENRSEGRGREHERGRAQYVSRVRAREQMGWTNDGGGCGDRDPYEPPRHPYGGEDRAGHGSLPCNDAPPSRRATS